MKELNLREIEKKTYMSYHQDGLIDVFVGIYVLLFGLGILLMTVADFSSWFIIPGKGGGMAKIKPLKDCLLFRDFSDKGIALISQAVSEKKIPKGTPIFVEGMLGDTLFVVKKGKVSISRSLPGVGEVELGVIESGGYFGEMALIDGGNRAVSARTLVDTEVLTVDRDDFLRLVEKEMLVAMRLVMAIAKGITNRTRDNLSMIDEYLTWRLGKKEEAQKVLEGISSGMKVVENQSYYSLLYLYQGTKSEAEVEREATSSDLELATLGYGIGAWYLYNGKTEKAKEVFKKIVNTSSWPAFGYIAAETELVRMIK